MDFDPFVINVISAYFYEQLKKLGGPKELLKKIPKLPEKFHSFFVGRPDFIDREDLLNEIRGAIRAYPQTHIIYLYGEGGVGKTRLLEEVGNITRQELASQISSVRWSGLLDMYHPSHRSVLGLQQLMIERLDPGKEHFKSYRKVRYTFDKRLEKGISGQTMDQARRELDKNFWLDYQKFTQEYRVVLALDTVENLNFESDKIQQIFQIDNRHVAVYDWLLRNIGQCENSVVLLAGRPRERFAQELKNTLHGQVAHYDPRPLDGLDRFHFMQLLDHLLEDIKGQETEGKIQDVLDLEEHGNLLYEFTAGYPVRLALFVELMAQISFVELPSEKELGAPSAWREKLIPSFFWYDYSHQEQRACLFFILAIARRGVTPPMANGTKHLMPPCGPRL